MLVFFFFAQQQQQIATVSKQDAQLDNKPPASSIDLWAKAYSRDPISDHFLDDSQWDYEEDEEKEEDGWIGLLLCATKPHTVHNEALTGCGNLFSSLKFKTSLTKQKLAI